MLKNPLHSAPFLRKQLLGVISDRLLPPLLAGESPRIIRAGLPFTVPPDVKMEPLPLTPLRPEDSTYFYPDGYTWESALMHSLPVPQLTCVHGGEAVFRFGVTEEMAQNQSGTAALHGGYSFHCPAITYMLVPGGMPVPTGNFPPWTSDNPPRLALGIMQLRFLPDGVLCGLSSVFGGELFVGYSLFFEEPAVNFSAQILDRELARGEASPEVTRAQLMVLLLNLERHLLQGIPQITDGYYSRFPSKSQNSVPTLAPNNQLLVAFHDYLVLHLHEDLTPARLASHVGITASQLNRLLRANLGSTTMQYLRARRIEAASLLLSRTRLPVSQIARLVGYVSLPHFSRDFKADFDYSPLKYRQMTSANGDILNEITTK